MHPPCAAAGYDCETCAAAQAASSRHEVFARSLLPSLGLPLSDKGQPSAQSGSFLGIDHDTVQGKLYLPERKLANFQAELARVSAAATTTPRALASLWGKGQH